MSEQKKITPRKKSFLMECKDPSDMIDFYETFENEGVRKWFIDNYVTRANIEITEEIQWDIAPMRNFLHGVVLPAFQEQFNETEAGDPAHGKKPYFSLEDTKDKCKELVFDTADVSTEELSPHDYWMMINVLEQIYFNLYNTMYDLREKPLNSHKKTAPKYGPEDFCKN